MTALAILGSATSTSLMSAGRSSAMDLPTPRATKCDPASLAARRAAGAGRSAAAEETSGASAMPSISAQSVAARASGTVMPSLIRRDPRGSSRRHRLAHAETHHVHRVAARLVELAGSAFADIAEAAQRERQRAGLPRQGDGLDLARRQLERGRLAHDDLLAVFLLELLVDREHADVAQDDLARLCLAVALAIAAGENHVDVVVRQNEARRGAFRRNGDGNRAHARRQDRRHESRPVRSHQLGLANRLAGDERRARDRAVERAHGVRLLAPADEIAVLGALGPGLPSDVLRGDSLPHIDVGLGHEHVDGGSRRLRRLGLFRRGGSSREQGGDAAGGERNGQHDDTGGFHALTLCGPEAAGMKGPAVDATARAGFDQRKVKAWLRSGDQIALILSCRLVLTRRYAGFAEG